LGPMDKKMFLHIHPDFGPYIGMWDEWFIAGQKSQ
jgi:hypothetical protein